MQQTLREKIEFSGIGLHSGLPAHIVVLPALENTGITFVRSDLPPHPAIRAHVDYVVDTTLATTLGISHCGTQIKVATVEHLLAAFAGVGLDNAQVLVQGPEIPIVDGSAAPFVNKILSCGLENQRWPRRVLVMRREVRVDDGVKRAQLLPHHQLEITCSLDFNHPLIAPVPFHFIARRDAFVRHIASARTFGFKKDVESLQAKGLARGGSLENAVVIDQDTILNPKGLRFSNECVRHKVLDALGDLSLLGFPFQGHAIFHRTGHALNYQLVQQVLNDSHSFDICEVKTNKRPVNRNCANFDLLDSAESIA